MKKTASDFSQTELDEFVSGALANNSVGMSRQTLAGQQPDSAPSTETSPSAEVAGEKQGGHSLFPAVMDENSAPLPASTPNTPPTVTHRVSSKQRKLSLDEYRATFLQVPRIVNRRPVFVSEEVRQRLDLIVLRLSETRRMSVTGLLENICRHHLAIYGDDIEQWRKL